MLPPPTRILYTLIALLSLCTASAQSITSTFAGSGSFGSTDGGTGTAATFLAPSGVAVDAFGNVYVADTYNYKIRMITSIGVVTTLAGNGSPGSTDGIGTVASFNTPGGVVVDTSGNVYVADTGNNKIRKITAQVGSVLF
jgi:serine/threonine protein kinase, bacterial